MVGKKDLRAAQGVESAGLGERPEESGRAPSLLYGAAEWLRGPVVAKVLSRGRAGDMHLFWDTCPSSALPYRQLGVQGWGSGEEGGVDIRIEKS